MMTTTFAEPLAFDVPVVRRPAAKLTDHILVGREMPRHIQIAYGRHIFALAHRGRNCGLWFRDLPLSMFDLWHDYGFKEPLMEYYRECRRTGESPQF